ncbi:hypothetical protein SAMN04488504_104104 [Myxococcus virescens]|uniref:Uncharacterized protein n=1 Tax=Myxococcus virescens TaxID=83456 RepID=A0ABY0MNL9_9BACT|nr:hypothetical protein SAMN04488504_104104 [Myxococcus virescens]
MMSILGARTRIPGAEGFGIARRRRTPPLRVLQRDSPGPARPAPQPLWHWLQQELCPRPGRRPRLVRPVRLSRAPRPEASGGARALGAAPPRKSPSGPRRPSWTSRGTTTTRPTATASTGSASGAYRACSASPSTTSPNSSSRGVPRHRPRLLHLGRAREGGPRLLLPLPGPAVEVGADCLPSPATSGGPFCRADTAPSAARSIGPRCAEPTGCRPTAPVRAWAFAQARSSRFSFRAGSSDSIRLHGSSVRSTGQLRTWPSPPCRSAARPPRSCLLAQFRDRL